MKKLFFIGIGGIGMSALARYYLQRGFKISGSDSEKTDLIDKLIAQGIEVHIGHDTVHIKNFKPDQVFYTEAIDKHNPEFLACQKSGIKCLSYFEGLGEISKSTKCIAVTGTHGKSTTTAILGILMQELGLHPDVIVGTQVPNFGNSNYLPGSGEYLVVEACEYRESFLHLDVYGAIILNLEADHLDHYKTEENYLKGFKTFVQNVHNDGFIIANGNDNNTKKVISHAKCSDIMIIQPEGKYLETIPKLSTPGDHIKQDALFAIKTIRYLFPTIGENEIISKLYKFKGTWRRFENIGEINGNPIISDYGHHPTEIQLTLKGAKQKYLDKKIICIFEPHQYSRTIKLFDGFCSSFKDCHEVIIPSIYEVRDLKSDVAKMSPSILANGIKEISDNAKFIDGYKKTKMYILDLLNKDKSKYVILVMGAGPIDDLARNLI